jgi:serine/threonine protein phosphatase PrpC
MGDNGLTFTSAGRSHKGAVRALNEDAILDRSDTGLWAVADGMGGHKAGDVASQSIVDELTRVSESEDCQELVNNVQAGLRNVNKALYEEGSAVSDDMTMGSTVVALIADGELFAVVWAGDSRLYLLRDQNLRQITRDHSYVQELLEQGQIDQEAAENHPMRNVITRAVGADPDVKLDTLEDQIQSGDCFFLCTDGVSNVLSDFEIRGLIEGDPLDVAAEKIEALCLERGAPDNLSFVIVVANKEADVRVTQKSAAGGWLSRLFGS